MSKKLILGNYTANPAPVDTEMSESNESGHFEADQISGGSGNHNDMNSNEQDEERDNGNGNGVILADTDGAGNVADREASNVLSEEEIEVIPAPDKPAAEVVVVTDGEDDESEPLTIRIKKEDGVWKVDGEEEQKDENEKVEETPVEPPQNPPTPRSQEASGSSASEAMVITISDDGAVVTEAPSFVRDILQIRVNCLRELVHFVDKTCKTYRAPSLNALTIVALEMPITDLALSKLPGLSMTVRDIYWKGILKITKKHHQQKFEVYRAAVAPVTVGEAVQDVKGSLVTEAVKKRPSKSRVNKNGAKKRKRVRRNQSDTSDEDSTLETEDTEDSSEGDNTNSEPPKRTRQQVKK